MNRTTRQTRDGAGRGWGAWLGRAGALGLTMTGLFLLLGGSLHPASEGRAAATPEVTRVALSLPATPEVTRVAPGLPATPRTRPIEQVQVGDRVLAGNPEMAGDRVDSELDPATWRRVELTMPKGPDRDDAVRMVLLRPSTWFERAGAVPGSTVELDMPELGIVGPARVESTAPCPPIKPGTGRIVTGTFAHQSDSVLDLSLDGLSEPIGITAGHLVYSEDRREFLAARELAIGERVVSEFGTSRVTAVSPRPGTHPIYNLEVDVEHVYHVSRHGILVHNACPIVIGRYMSRVEAVGKETGWKTYNARPRTWSFSPTNTAEEIAKGVKNNAQWLRNQIKEGRRIFDIGAPKGAGLGNYYGKELSILREAFRRVPRGSVSAGGKVYPLFEWIPK